jgi:CheY-like chemotaxis protein
LSQAQRPDDNTGEAKKTTRESRRKSVCQPAPGADLYDNDSISNVGTLSLASSAGAVPLRVQANQSDDTATPTAAVAADDQARRTGSVIVMSAADKKQKKLQEMYQSLQGTRVLLVEDNIVNQKVAKLMLTSLGCDVAIAGNGQIGLDLIAQRAPEEAFDVVLMDLQMPVMDGFIASTRIRQRERAENLQRTPIITLTASTTSEYQERCSACGMDGWLSKPFSKEQLATAIATWKDKFPIASTPPSSPEFSPPSDDGFDAVAQDAAAGVPAQASEASSSTAQQQSVAAVKHSSEAEASNNSFKHIHRESPAMAIPTSTSSDHLSTVHHHHHSHADRSNLHRSASA